MTLAQRIREIIKDDPEKWCYVATGESFCIISKAKDVQEWCAVVDREWRRKTQKAIERAYAEKFNAKQKGVKAKEDVERTQEELAVAICQLDNQPKVKTKEILKAEKELKGEIDRLKKKLNGAKYNIRYSEFRVKELERLIGNKEKYLETYKTLWKRKLNDEWRRRFEQPLGLILKCEGNEKGRFWSLDEMERAYGKQR